jgi:hypothetical protein
MNRTLRLSAWLLFLVFALACVVPLGAASAPAADKKPYALVYVNVFLASGRVAYGVPVKIRRADKKKTLDEGTSDHSGEIAFRVPPGPADYIVWADIKQPKKKVADPVGATSQDQAGLEVKVRVEGDERVDVALHLPESAKPY